MRYCAAPPVGEALMSILSVQLTLGEMAFVKIIGIDRSISGRTWKWGWSRS